MFCVSSFSWENRLTGLFVQTMCLIDRHLQVFLAILDMYVSVLISSIHRSRKRPMFDLYLGRPITSDIPTISIRETFCCLAIVSFSLFWPSLSLSIVFALADDEHLQQWRIRKRKMKTSSSKREQIDSDRLSSSFSRTIIWRCYRREKKKKREERKEVNNLAAGDRCPSNKNKTQERKREREKTTVTANHASMMYNNNRTPFFFFFFSLLLSLYLSCSHLQ